MPCTDCPELIPNPNEGCLKPILSSCVTFDGEGNLCVDTTEGQNLNQIIQKLSDLVCEAKNSNWLNNLNVSCLVDFPTLGTTQEKYQYIIDNQCSLQEQINTIILNSTTIANVGGGAEIFKGLNSNINEFRTITTEVIQPTSPELLEGNVSANTSVVGDNVKLQLDFSQLKVKAPATDGYLAYYVYQTNSPTYIPDGSITRPYSSWSACKNQIIGSGTIANPQRPNVRVIFLNNISTNEDMSVNRVTYEFRSNSVFNYRPNTSETLEDAVIDFQKINNINPNTVIDIKVVGVGEITRGDTNDVSKQMIINVKGISNSGINRVFAFEESCNITIRGKSQPNNLFTPLLNPDNNQPLVASNGYPIIGIKDSDNLIPIINGLITIDTSNNSSTSEFYIRENCFVTIVTNTQRAIYVDNSRGFIIGSLSIENSRPSAGCQVRYNDIDNSIISPYSRRFTPSNEISMISIVNAGVLNTSATGSISYNQNGSMLQGGFNSFVELEGGSTFLSTSDIGLGFEEFAQFNHLLHIKGNSASNVFNIKRLNTRLNPRKSIFSADNLAESVTRILTINGGTVETNLAYARETPPFSIYSSSTMKANTTIRTNVLLLSGLLTFDFSQIPTTGSTDFANFVRGTIYRKNDGTDWLLAIKS